MSSRPEIQCLYVGEITEQDVQRLVALHLSAFPRLDRDVAALIHKTRHTWWYDAPLEPFRPRRYIVREGDRIVANASAWSRDIVTNEGPMTVLALAGVASAPDMRDRGLGVAAVRAVFDHVDRGEFSWSLLQTSQRVRPFYEKLGGRAVDNTFVNSKREDNPRARPWWDEVVMIYPGGRDGWPGGEIDLLGPAW